LKKDSRTIYERTSYAIPIVDPSTQKKFEIQITMDEGILLYSYSHNTDVDAYKSDSPLTVVELKVPTEIIDPATKGFKQEMVQNIPSLVAVQNFLNLLTTFQAPGYEKDSGKQSLIRSVLEAQKAAQ